MNEKPQFVAIGQETYYEATNNIDAIVGLLSSLGERSKVINGDLVWQAAEAIQDSLKRLRGELQAGFYEQESGFLRMKIAKAE